MKAHTPPSEIWLTKDQIKTITHELNVSMIAVGKAFGTNERTARRWSVGDMLMPAGVCVLMRLLLSLKRKDSYEQMADKLEEEARLLRALAEFRAAREAKKTLQAVSA